MKPALKTFDVVTCAECIASGSVWCDAGSLCVAGAFPAEFLKLAPGDALLCSSASAWTSTCPTVPAGRDPLYDANKWAFDLINVESVWASGVTGNGILINIIDSGPDHTHPDFSSKFDSAASCNGGVDSATDLSHGTTTAAIALAAANDHCSRGIAYGATLAKCPLNAPVAKKWDHALDKIMISSNSWGIDPCEKLANTRRKMEARGLRACPFAARTGSPCSAAACSSTDWSSAPAKSCTTVISNYCQRTANYEADTECASWTHLWMRCEFSHLHPSHIRALKKGIDTGRSGKGVVYIFASGNENDDGENVNHEQYLHSRFTVTVGATDKLGRHAYYSTPGASLFISAPGGDTVDHANNWVVANQGGGCGKHGQGTSYACPVVSGVVALMLEVRPELTYRDVHGVLASTATKTDPTESG